MFLFYKFSRLTEKWPSFLQIGNMRKYILDCKFNNIQLNAIIVQFDRLNNKFYFFKWNY